MKRRRRPRSSTELARTVPSRVALDARLRSGAGAHGGTKAERARKRRREARRELERGDYEQGS